MATNKVVKFLQEIFIGRVVFMQLVREASVRYHKRLVRNSNTQRFIEYNIRPRIEEKLVRTETTGYFDYTSGYTIQSVNFCEASITSISQNFQEWNEADEENFSIIVEFQTQHRDKIITSAMIYNLYNFIESFS